MSDVPDALEKFVQATMDSYQAHVRKRPMLGSKPKLNPQAQAMNERLAAINRAKKKTTDNR